LPRISLVPTKSKGPARRTRVPSEFGLPPEVATAASGGADKSFLSLGDYENLPTHHGLMNWAVQIEESLLMKRERV
jgi:hypothetical protein